MPLVASQRTSEEVDQGGAASEVLGSARSQFMRQQHFQSAGVDAVI